MPREGMKVNSFSNSPRVFGPVEEPQTIPQQIAALEKRINARLDAVEKRIEELEAKKEG